LKLLQPTVLAFTFTLQSKR